MRLLGLILLFLMLAGCSLAPPVQEVLPPIDDQALLVVIDDPRSEIRRRGGGPGYSVRQAYDEDPALARAADRLASDYALTILTQWPLRSLGVHCFVVKPPSARQRAALTADTRVRWVQLFNEFELQAVAGTGSVAESLAAQFTKEITARGKGIKIAVVDTAVDRKHPDLQQSLLSSSNFAGRRGNPDSESHGTAVVGLIAAVPSSVKGVMGLASDAHVHLLRGCWQESATKGRCNTLTLALALDAAIHLRPDVLNLSLSGGQDRLLDSLLKVLLDQGTVVVAAFDEKRRADERFPAPRTGVVYAYGVGEDKQNQMSQDVLMAPRHALTLAPMAAYDLVSGHSIATPYIASMLACLMDQHRDDSPTQIVSRLQRWLAVHFQGP